MRYSLKQSGCAESGNFSKYFRVDQGESFSQPNTPGGSNRGKSPGADQLGADTIVSDADDQSFASKNNESPPPPRLAQPRAAAALTEEA